ncbi:hypothetical protein Aci011_024 [Acinetobacter phage vB_AbaM_B09_Aci01-1]|uniref:Thioredoxin domain-containing protein n=2 Tax=Saclayvirus TaxID=2733128 RepID=A0A386KMT6_9CAUD|nr:thioredoxin domain [Acinetobacter phage vB_AbaM_B09_Aci01-1]YP_009813247.1 thioredoxin domain [Acinetobacter phage vB_AbaM_B09_Aci02-2]AYD85642.1 hypothetical protein Aci011_024 [Acinetobacter phage vB_AbaM_B09_Aci01-1]AYD85803.1 hypothetical protein Aci022_025 [Acinetobacter phage vB_AbaM_B09_Aci02-2]
MIKNKLIKFGASWCAPCKAASKFLSQFDSEKYIEVDVTNDVELAEKFSVKQIPTFVLVNANGDEIDRFSSFNPALVKQAIEKIK